jgi:hypothetical protein
MVCMYMSHTSETQHLDTRVHHDGITALRHAGASRRYHEAGQCDFGGASDRLAHQGHACASVLQAANGDDGTRGSRCTGDTPTCEGWEQGWACRSGWRSAGDLGVKREAEREPTGAEDGTEPRGHRAPPNAEREGGGLCHDPELREGVECVPLSGGDLRWRPRSSWKSSSGPAVSFSVTHLPIHVVSDHSFR